MGTATGNPSKGLSHTIQRIKPKQNEGETKTNVSPDSSKTNLKYLVILYAVCFGGTGKIMGRIL